MEERYGGRRSCCLATDGWRAVEGGGGMVANGHLCSFILHFSINRGITQTIGHWWPHTTFTTCVLIEIIFLSDCCSLLFSLSLFVCSFVCVIVLCSILHCDALFFDSLSNERMSSSP